MVKIFVSYAHTDETFLTDNLIPILNELKSEGVADYFYDRLIMPGEDLFKKIDENMDECDISILLLSESYYQSNSCKKEKSRLLNRRILDGIYLLPMVVSSCDWERDDVIKNNLLLNTDAKELDQLSPNELKTEFEKIKEKLSLIARDIETISALDFSKSFTDLLEDTDVLKTSHRLKDTLLLSDVFIYPILKKNVLDNEKEEIISSDMFFEDSKDSRFIFISGDDVSGKTSLIKKFICDIKEKNFIPLLFSSTDDLGGDFLTKRFKKQFAVEMPDKEIKRLLGSNKERIIIFVDDYHKISNRSKFVNKIDSCCKIVCTVDLIYSLDLEIEEIHENISRYSIKELSPSKRNDLIQKWLRLGEDPFHSDDFSRVKEIDKKTELIESITYKSLNGGIMPAYPFLILSILSNFETLNRPLNQQVTSYGYCYEALIIIALTKVGLKSDDQIAGAINFLSNFAYELYKLGYHEMANMDFQVFLDNYEKKFSIPFKKDIFIDKLLTSRLIINSLGNYGFDYKYIYYFFVAIYFSNNFDELKEEIANICKNIHRDENAYIAIFFSHNAKSEDFYNMLLEEANSLYSNIDIATLAKEDMGFFNNSCQWLKFTLPNERHNYKIERANALKRPEKEYSHDEEIPDETHDQYMLNLRKSIKLTEAIGIIAKNRYTAIQKLLVKKLLTAAIDLSLRGLNSFFDLFRETKSQENIINFIAEFIKQEENKRGRVIKDEEYQRIANKIFWRLNFFQIYVVLTKTIRSIGSEHLIPFVDQITKEKETPSYQIILEGMKMTYEKNVDTNNLSNYIKKSNNYSLIAKNILRMFVIDYCRMNPVRFNEIQKLSNRLEIKIDKLKK
ncbi:toll/interleukin-1 receptor domain-containing protein [bacterium]|nr:toll/interleukin-1 receptor domain-containing protein [bacterium]